MVTRREFIQASALLGGVAIGGNSFSPLRPPGKDSAAINPTVTTALGKLRGRYANGLYSFKGVHYGASTEGRLRFRPPVPAKPWVGIRDAYEVGPPAPQVLGYGGFWAGLSGPGRMSEDCLVLNVWTPGLRAQEKKPVLVWLHGGHYGVGSGGAALYDGANLAAKHDVVLLTINHRLNIFGYLYLQKLCGDRFADSGNAGMLDIVLALQWVRDNIAQFGGDPANVTLFGQSGGGYKISTLMAMPSAQQLFHKAVIQSGSALRADSAQEADALASKCLSQLSVSPDRIDDLIDLPADHVITTLQKMKPDPFFSFAPVVDGRSLPRQPFTPDAPVATANVPMLIGTNLHETTSLNGDFDPSSFSLDDAALRNRLKSSLHLNDESSLDALIATYQTTQPRSTPSDIYFAVTTDADFRMDAIAQAERKVSQRSAPVYMYRFDWPLPIEGGRFKAAHGAEIPCGERSGESRARGPQQPQARLGLMALSSRLSIKDRRKRSDVMVRSLQRRCFAGAILALVFVSLAAQNTKAQGSANSVQCGNQEASQLLQRGHDMFPKSGYGLPPVVASAGRALTYFELAAEKDPSCAQAQVALAKAEIGFPSWPGLPERFQMVKEAAMRAIELQDGLAEAHALLGDAEFNTWQWQPAEKEYKRAIELAPNDPSNHLRYARFLAAMGRPAQAVDEAEKARALAHGSPPVDLAAGEIYYWTRRYDKAVELIRPAVGSNPMGNFLLGWACAGQSNWQDAINAFATILPITDRDAGDLMSLAYAYASDGRRTDVLPMLEEAKQKTTLMYVPLYRIAATYLAMGDRKQALEWLEKAATEDPGWMVWIKVDPVMDPLRSDPRFQKLVEEMKFPSQARN